MECLGLSIEDTRTRLWANGKHQVLLSPGVLQRLGRQRATHDDDQHVLKGACLCQKTPIPWNWQNQHSWNKTHLYCIFYVNVLYVHIFSLIYHTNILSDLICIC